MGWGDLAYPWGEWLVFRGQTLSGADSDVSRARRRHAGCFQSVSLSEAQAEIAMLATRQARADRDFEGILPPVLSLESQINLEGRRLLLPVAGAVALVFLIACGNATGLLLARGLQRQHECSVRAALGAGTFQLCRPVLMESLLLALLGGMAGATLSVWCVGLLKAIAGAGIPRLDAVRIGWPLVAFCLGASAVAGLSAGFLPALRSLGWGLATELKSGSRTASLGRTERRLLGRLVAGQIALTLALLVGAGLLIRTVQSLARIRPGYDTQNILTMSVTTVGTNNLGYHTAALDRVAQLPGVKAVAFGWGVPLTGNKWEMILEIEGRPSPDGPRGGLSFSTRSVTGWRPAFSANCARSIPPSRWRTLGPWSKSAPIPSHRGRSR